MLTVLFIVGLLVAVAGIALAARTDRKFASSVIAAAGVVIALACCFSTVDARSVGIQTGFGKYRDTLGAGFHLTAPWSSVEEWTTRNQTIRFEADGKADERDNYFTEPRITVRLGNQSEAYVDVTVTWGITEKSVQDLWRQYKTFGDARRDFVTPQALGATNTAFDGYDPFRGLDEKTADSPYIPLAVWSQKITDALRPLYAARSVELISVQVTKVTYDGKTEEKLRQYSDAIANTRIKAQDVKTAEQEAAASKARAQTAAPGCEALLRDLAAQDKLKDLPAGWQCPGVTGPAVVSAK